jgi:hypothetical protein
MRFTIPKPYFPLTIKLDPNGLEWTHFIGVSEFVKTPGELPSSLTEQLLPMLEWINSDTDTTLIVEESTWARLQEARLNILRLTAWWIEWTRRRTVANDHFLCTHCNQQIVVKPGSPARDKTIYRCPNKVCATHALVANATGKPQLRVVEGAKSA